jgi:uncharacterized membrane protein YphA (DoxX/SURF4 family)
MHTLQIFIGFVFIIAGIMRFIYPNENTKERITLYPFVPNGEYVIAISEIFLGLLLFTKYSKASLYILAVGIVVYTILVFHSQWKNIHDTLRNICTYKGTAKSVVLHITYLIIIIYLLFSSHENK